MEHKLFATVDDMLDPEVLSILAAVPVKEVRCTPLSDVEANSGSTFQLIETNDQRGPCFFLKRMPSLVKGTSDARHPSVTCWQQGLFHQLPSTIVQVTAACSHDGAGFALLMHDVRAELMSNNKHLTQGDNTQFLDAMAAMHATFWEDAQLKNPHLGLYRPCHLYPSYSCQSMQDSEGWRFLKHFVKYDSIEPIQILLQDPTMLCDALNRYPSTLLHNDLWWANLGIRREPCTQVIILDWDFTTIGPPSIDLAFYIGENASLLPIRKEEVIDYYRKSLSRHLSSHFDDQWWLPQLELGLLGCFLRRGKWLLLGIVDATDTKERTRLVNELEWWLHHARIGIEQL